MGQGGTITATALRRPADDADGAPNAVRVAIDTNPDFSNGPLADFCRTHAPTPFQHPDWLRHFYGTLAPAREAEAQVVVGRSGAGNDILFVLPLIRRRKSGVSLLETTDLGVSDYAAPIISPRLVDAPAARAAVAPVLPHHDILRIRPIRREHVGGWQSLLGGRAEELDFAAHATHTGFDYAVWRSQALSDSFARNLDRKKKKFLKTQGAGLRLLREPDEIRAAIGAIRQLRIGRFDGDMIQHAAVHDFYADVAAGGVATGIARTYVLTDGTEPVAYVFGLGWRGRYHYLLIGCDYQRFGRHSPGLIIYDMMIEDWSRNGGSVFDFTIGDEPFKAHYGTEPTRMFMLGGTPTWRGRLAIAAVEAKKQFDRLRRRSGNSGEEDVKNDG